MSATYYSRDNLISPEQLPEALPVNRPITHGSAARAVNNVHERL